MADLFQIDKLQLAFLVVVPGFVSLKVWSLIHPTARPNVTTSLVDVVCYSFLNFAALFWLIPIATHEGNQFWSSVFFLMILLVFPTVWPIFVKVLLSAKWMRGKTLNPIPSGWDYFFGRNEPCFILLHLKSGKLIGGLYYKNSFASAYPERQDLYIAEVWRIDEHGCFLEKVPDTKGMLISHEFVDYIELFDSAGGSQNGEGQQTKQ